jgi:sodium-dependent dicarboxylate transporter 2/3/5
MKPEEHVVAADVASGALTPAAREAAIEHLSACKACRQAVQAAQQAAVRPPLVGLGLPARLATARPLRIFLPRFAHRLGRAASLVGRFGIVAGLTAGTLLLPVPEGLSEPGHRALVLLVFTASILALEPVSLPIAALLVPLAQVALGIADTPRAFQPFSRPVVFLVLSSMFLAEAFRKHGLARRLAMATLVASRGNVRVVLLGFMGVAAFLSMWVENTATAAMLIPVALTASRQVQDAAAARSFLVLLVLGIAYSASLGGMGTIMGSASNAVASGFLAQAQPWRFTDWMRYGVPSFLLVFPLTWWLLLRMVRVPMDRLDVEPARHAMHKQGRMTRSEWEVVATIAFAIALWVGGESLEAGLGLPPTLLSASLVGVAAVGYLAARGIVTWEDVKGVSWGIFFIIGAGLSLGDALVDTGATAWIAELVAPIVTDLPAALSILALVLLSAFLTNVLSNTTIAAVFVPVLMALTQGDSRFSAVQLVLPVALATTFGYSLPSASGRMALISASGIITRTEMLRYGLVTTLASALVLGVFFYALFSLGWI